MKELRSSMLEVAEEIASLESAVSESLSTEPGHITSADLSPQNDECSQPVVKAVVDQQEGFTPSFPQVSEAKAQAPRRGEQMRMQFSFEARPVVTALTDASTSSQAAEELVEVQRSERANSQRSLGLKGLRAEPKARKRDVLHRLVSHPAFEAFFCALILLNSLCLAVEAQYVSYSLAAAVGYQVHRSFRKTHEIVLKMLGLRSKFFKDCWNWLDLVIVLMWVLDYGSRVLALVELPVNVQILRIARLARFLRLVHILKFLQGPSFDSINLMMAAIRGSFYVLQWTMLIMCVIHLMLALVMNQFLREFYFNKHLEHTSEVLVMFEYYGSFTRFLLTMFELTLANWPPAARLLIENVSEWFIVYVLTHKMVLGLAVLSVVNSVFMQETFRVASNDDSVMVRQFARKDRPHTKKMMQLFAEADKNSDESIDMNEWKAVCEHEWVQNWLAAQELKVSDAGTLFNMIDNGDGRITAKELIDGVERLKGPASGLDIRRMFSRLMSVVEPETGGVPACGGPAKPLTQQGSSASC